jgi:Flp pilus assembly pilin Flp
VTGTPRRGTRPRESGQGIVEYGLILFIAVVVCVASLLIFGDQIATMLRLIASAV